MIFTCKNCGGNAVFDPKRQAMYCPHCDSEDSADRLENQSSTVCSNCGAPIEVERFTSATKCPHCGTYIILENRVQGSMRPGLILPFKVSKREAVRRMEEEFEKRIFTPSTFLSQSTMELLEGSYVPFWLYNYDGEVEYEAKATKVRTWTTGKTEYVETSHYRVVRDMHIDFEKIPVDASTRMADDIMDLLEPYQYKDLIDFDELYMSGFLGEYYSETEDKMSDRAKEKVAEATESILKESVNSCGYSTVKPVHKEVSIVKEKAVFALLPVWVYRYRFRNSQFLIYVNGQTGKVIGESPRDNRKIWGYASTVFALTLLFGFFVKIILGVF